MGTDLIKSIPTFPDIGTLQIAAEKALTELSNLSSSKELSDDAREKVQKLTSKANPQKLGVSEENDVKWVTPRMILAQPTTQSEARPENARQGDIFTSTGNLVPRPLVFYPIFFFEANIMFEPGQKAPKCSSPDAKFGQPYGACQACPYLPFGKQGGGRGEQKKTDCNNQIVAIVIDAEFGEVYEIPFAKTSRGAGNSLRNLAGQGDYAWQRAFTLDTEKKVGDLGTYYVYKVNAKGQTISPDLEKVARALYFLYAANRKLFLSDWYGRLNTAAAHAKEIESNISREALAGNIGATDEEPDLTTVVAAPKDNVRSSSKPM